MSEPGGNTKILPMDESTPRPIHELTAGKDQADVPDAVVLRGRWWWHVWTWGFPNPLAAIAVPVITATEMIALLFTEDHLNFTDLPTVLTAPLLNFTGWWLLAWLVHLFGLALGWTQRTTVSRWLGQLSGIGIVAFGIAAWMGSWWLYASIGRFAAYKTVLFLLQTAQRWEMLWTPAASQRGSVLIAAVVAIVIASLLVTYRPNRIRKALAATRPRGLLRFGYSLLALYVLWIGLTAWCLSGFSSLRKLERREALTQKTSPLVTLALSSIAAFNIEAIPADVLDTDELVNIEQAQLQRDEAIARPGKKHNVVIIQIESLRADCIQAKHQGVEVTPNLNRLADSGIEFTNAYSQSTHSNYADPCIASSQYPLRGRTPRPYRRGDPYPKTLIYDLLKPRGYSTAIISSQNEAWFSMDQFYESPNLDLIFDPQRVDGQTNVDVRDWGMAREELGGTLKGGKFIDSFTTDSAIDWVQQQDQDGKPFYLQMNLQSSHFPYPLPEDVPRPFQPSEIDFPASFVTYPKDKTHVVRNAYFNAIAECDRQVGRIVNALREIVQYDNTILIVVGENGESFYEDGTVTHAGPPSQVQLNVAWIMTGLGVGDPHVEDYPVELIDVVPTTLGLLGLPPDANHQGIDVLDADRPKLAERFLFFHVNSPHGFAVATIWGGRWKFIAFQPGTWDHVTDLTGRGEALFDLHHDPEETRNLVTERDSVTTVLREVLERWRVRQLAYYHHPHLHMGHFPPRPPTGNARK